MYQATVILNIQANRKHVIIWADVHRMTYLVQTPWIEHVSLSWFHFWYGSGHSQVPGRRTDLSGDADAVLMHAPWSLDSFRSVLQYGVLLVEDDAVVQLHHIVGWVVWPIDVAPLSD